MTSDTTAPVGDGTPKPFGPMATLGWAILAFVAGQMVGTVVVLTWFDAHAPTSLSSVRYDGALVALVTLITNPIIIVMLAIVARLAGWNPAEYLGLTRFTFRDFAVGIAAVAGLVAAVDLYSYAAGLDIVSTFQTDSFTSARHEGWLAALALAVIVIGPAGEEILFRGFLFRGWVRPGLPGAFAVAFISLLWTALHVQYDWFGITQVFLIGLVLGWLRWRSGSTTLTLVLHILVNLESSIETMVKAAWSA
jgi:membrane protease YdiL (CAAX protease family)